MNQDNETPSHVLVERGALQALIDALGKEGYQVVGPTVKDGAIVYDRVSSLDDLPIGWSDEQEAGTYRLKKRSDQALFGYAVGPHSWKQFLYPPKQRLTVVTCTEEGMTFSPDTEETPQFAFLGVRACELRAIAIQDQVFLGGPYRDQHYKLRREQVFLVAVNCGQAAGTCFCVSMNAGPKVERDFDLALTEIIDAKRHVFLVEIGSARGQALMQHVPHTHATIADQEKADDLVAETARHMGRSMQTNGIKKRLYEKLDDPRWDQVAERCLSCGNCTMVCPTCFCSTVEDTTDLTGEQAERYRTWDSCFTMDFSHLHGGSVRSSVKSRYRQWLTHKLATWIDQFGTSGCVGCGRCITWCPVGIDITEEVNALQHEPDEVARSNEEGH